jgi:CheY-like chemotaxis protein
MHRQPQILIVDDDGFIRDSVEHIAKFLGYKSTLAKNGHEALVCAKKKIFDLIISDLYMPEMDGHELLKNIKEMQEYKNVPFLFLSGSNERSTWVKNLNAGADDFITKPFDKKILALKLKSHIKKHFLRKELLKSNMEYNINLREGIIIYCTLKNSKFKLKPGLLYAKVKIVYNSKELYKAVENVKIWLIIVDFDAVNEYNINKIKLSSDLAFSIILIANNINEVNSQIDNGIGNFILKSLPEKLFYHQINALIAREIEVKSKYINAIKLAVDNSPVRLESKTEQNFENHQISIIHEPFEHIPGGDFYEILSDPGNNFKIIVLGDVMGKKWGAWFFVNAYLAYIRSTIRFLLNNTPYSELTASGIIEHLNKQISVDLQIAEVFTTLSIIIIRKEKPVYIAAAGAMKPLMFKFKDQSISQLNITGMLLGISENSKYHQLEIELEPFDKLLFFSDGYTETYDSKTKEMLSADAVIRVFKELGKNKKLDIRQFEKTYIKKFNISSFDDDRTILLISKD